MSRLPRVLLIGKQRHPSFRQIKKAGLARGLDVHPYVFDDVVVEFTKNSMKIIVDDQPLESFQLVFFRSIGANSELAAMIVSICESKNIPVIDTYRHESHKWSDAKAFGYLKLLELGIPLIETLYLPKKKLDLYKSEIQFPCVAKVSSLNKGEGVFFCEDLESLRALYTRRRRLIVQRFIEHDEYVRVFVIGGKVVAACKRISGDRRRKRHGLLKHEIAEAYVPNNALKKTCERIASSFGYDIAGIDIVHDKTDHNWKVFEANSVPQFDRLMRATGVNIPDLIAKHLKRKLD